MKMTYDELKLSPLGKQDVVPEEVAIWLEMHSLCNASGMMNIFKLVEQYYHTGLVDLFDYGNSTNPFRKLYVDISDGYVSDTILKNLFSALFICKCISKKDIIRLLKFADAKVKRITKKYKLMHGCNASRISCPRSIENLLEVYAELAERLQNALEDMQDDAR